PAAEGVGQQHLGVEARRLRALLLQETGRPVEQPADGPALFGTHGNVPSSGFKVPGSPAREAVPDLERSTGNCVLAARLPQPLLLVEVFQDLDQLTEVAGDDAVELVQGEVDAVVGDAVLREVVGADALAAVAGADERAPLLGPGLVQLLLLPLVQPAAQD